MLPNEEEETLGTTGAEDGGGTTVEVASVSGEIGYEECEQLEVEWICWETG
jgi:hypothetical protein